jgi:hypothetical protein
VTRDESKNAIVDQWNRLPTWRRRNSQDAAEFAQIMLTSRPDLADFDCPFDRFLVLRAWLLAEQRNVEQSKKAVPRKKPGPVSKKVAH